MNKLIKVFASAFLLGLSGCAYGVADLSHVTPRVTPATAGDYLGNSETSKVKQYTKITIGADNMYHLATIKKGIQIAEQDVSLFGPLSAGFYVAQFVHTPEQKTWAADPTLPMYEYEFVTIDKDDGSIWYTTGGSVSIGATVYEMLGMTVPNDADSLMVLTNGPDINWAILTKNMETNWKELSQKQGTLAYLKLP